MIFDFGKLFIHEPFDVSIIENSLSFDFGLAQMVEHEIPEIGGEPFGEGNTETFLLSMNDSFRQQSFGGFSEQIFRSKTLELVSWG